jgi:hypothetical protein
MGEKLEQYLRLVANVGGRTRTCYSHAHAKTGDTYTFFLCDRKGCDQGIILELTKSEIKRKQVCRLHPTEGKLEPIAIAENHI